MTKRERARSIQEFHDIVAEGYYDSDAYLVRGDEDAVEFRLSGLDAGLVTINRFLGAEVGVRREWKHIRARSSDVYVIWFPLSGDLALTQDKVHEGVTDSEHFVITCGDRPFHAKALSRGPEGCKQLHVTVPSHVARSYVPQIDQLCGKSFGASNGPARAAREIFNLLIEQGDLLPATTVESFARAGIDALAVGLREDISREPIQIDTKEMHLLRVLRYIDQHLSMQGLTAARVAADCKVSRRYLHYLVRYRDTTFSEYLWNTRLRQADEWLSDPEFEHFNIVDIAYMCGFRSASHFSSSYRTRFGYTPSKKRQHLADVQAEAMDG